jgi:hypothetical protein
LGPGEKASSIWIFGHWSLKELRCLLALSFRSGLPQHFDGYYAFC